MESSRVICVNCDARGIKAAPNMSRLPELTRLLRVLSRKHQPPMSLSKLCEELECKERSVKRYIRELRETHGYPIEYDREYGGYRLDSGLAGLELPGLFFSESELSALLTMRAMLSAVQPGLFEKDLAPLGRRVEELIAESGVEAAEVARRVRIVPIGSRPVDDKVFGACAQASLARRRLRLKYRSRGREGDWEEREVSPQRLVRYRENWYLDLWCHQREGLRVFSLDQIKDIHVLETQALDLSAEQVDREFKTSFGIFSGEPTNRAVLRFSAYRAQWVSKEDWHGQQTARWLEDGSYELTVPYARPEELVGDILKYGDGVEVLEPADLRQMVADVLVRMTGLYGSGENA